MGPGIAAWGKIYTLPLFMPAFKTSSFFKPSTLKCSLLFIIIAPLLKSKKLSNLELRSGYFSKKGIIILRISDILLTTKYVTPSST